MCSAPRALTRLRAIAVSSVTDVRRVVVASGVALGAAALAARYRSWHLRWGATEAEARGPMPGDGLLDEAAFVATRAVSIAAPPERVWPWLVQAGFGRAGFYSYDLLDNVRRPSADELLPELQHVAVGDLAAPMTSPANEQTAFTVAEIDERRVLVWAKPDSTWAWRLTTEDGEGTRLVTRLKARYELGPFLPVTVFLMEVGDFPMMRRMLLGIRERAERPVGSPSARGG